MIKHLSEDFLTLLVKVMIPHSRIKVLLEEGFVHVSQNPTKPDSQWFRIR